MEFDALIKNAKVIDGSGNAARRADIAIQDGRIAAVGHIASAAQTVVDATGLVAAPGFIDVHSHADLFSTTDPGRDNKLCQGVTTEITGMCGLGPAPVSRDDNAPYLAYLAGMGMPTYPQYESFTTFGSYLDFMETLPTGTNTAFFVPHGPLRIAEMGLSPDKPDTAQMQRMKERVREGMQSGALGLSSGLMYAPGIFAEEQEFIELCREMKPWDGIYTTHMRDHGRMVFDCVTETIRIAKSAGVRANISHNKTSGGERRGQADRNIQMIHEADIPVMYDVYPYIAGATILQSTLPPWLQKLPRSEIISYLKETRVNPSKRDDLFQAVMHPEDYFESMLYSCGLDGILISAAAVTPDAVGCSITRYADTRGLDPFTAYIELLIDNQLNVTYIGFNMIEDDVEAFIADPLCMIGSDSLYSKGMLMTHPRAFGTFPRVLGRYVRERGILPLEQAIRKMTSLPAGFYGLKGKGLLREGYDADIVLFNPDTIIDHADYQHPLLANEGIHRVFIAGETVVENDKPLGVLKGKVLRRS